jgi:phosphoribosylformylglycinamidine synthase
VTGDGRLVVKSGGTVVADIPNSPLAGGAPVYSRPVRKTEIPPAEISLDLPADEIEPAFMRLIASHPVACKEWVYTQYDHMVRTNTVVLPGSDAAVIRLKETRRALAMTLDSNARYCQADPRAGARLVVAEACRNIVVSGGRPLALTDCLNFASPERPEVMWQFSETIDGIAEACKAFGTPVTGGNVSFYNETEGRGIYPTPVIGMVGLLEDVHHATTQWFKDDGRAILLVGTTRNDLGATELLVVLNGEAAGNAPALDLRVEKAVQEACLRMIQAGLVESAHDCSDGGLAVALAEAAFSAYRKRAVGFVANIEGDLPATAALFSETPSRIVVSAEEHNVDALAEIASQLGVPVTRLGVTGGDRIEISVNGVNLVDRPLAEVESAWRSTLPRSLEVASFATAESK